MAGRPSKLTARLQQQLCKAIAAGNYYEAACASVGISHQTMLVWMGKGEAAKAGQFFEFREAVLKAVADAEVRVVAQWQKHMPENWQACRDFLARRFPSRWGEKQQVTGDGGGPVQVEVKFSEQDRLDAIHRLHARVGGGAGAAVADGHAPAD